MKTIPTKLAVWLGFGFGLVCVAADAVAFESKFTGFAQVTVGRVISGDTTEGQSNTSPYSLFSSSEFKNYNCPCFIGNYEYAGVYEYKKTQIAPETVVGLQGDFTFTPELSATAQAVARGADSSVGIDWAYLSYKLTPNLKVQVGHKRLPLYYYSDFMYIGYAYPWIRPAADLYGWQTYAYEGANLLYKTNWNQWAITSNAWIGTHSDKNNALLGKIYYAEKIEENWKKMIGGYVEATNDTISVRGIFMKTEVERFVFVDGVKTPVMGGPNDTTVNNVGQNFFGLAFNVDYEDWLIRTEMNYIDRPSVKNTYTTQSYSAGRQFGQHTVMLGWSQFRERSGVWPDGIEKHTTKSLSYRWDYAKSQAIKMQYDTIKDESKFLFTGNAHLLSASWNYTF
jgi:hypothetical protein